MGFPLDCHHGLELCTAIPFVLRRDPLRNRPSTFELAARIEPSALRTGVEINSTFRTLAVESNRRRQRRSTAGALRHLSEARHVDLPRFARPVASPRPTVPFWLVVRRPRLCARLVVVLISALSVFPRHRSGGFISVIYPTQSPFV